MQGLGAPVCGDNGFKFAQGINICLPIFLCAENAYRPQDVLVPFVRNLTALIWRATGPTSRLQLASSVRKRNMGSIQCLAPAGIVKLLFL
jgi:hypothetical protein